ncbi:MAG TPA: hypothetical protein PKV72_06815, partial [Candidatus Peribacteria bacterium]|nr:hypothetical protein [Candidatus Peribacteria bacterium]
MTPKKPIPGTPDGEREDLPEVVVPTHVIRIKPPVRPDQVADVKDEVAADIRTAFTGPRVKRDEPLPQPVDAELEEAPRTDVQRPAVPAQPFVTVMNASELDESAPLTAVTGRAAGRNQTGEVEFEAPAVSEEVTLQSVAYHVLHMGLANVPGVQAALEGDYATPEEFADAVCAVLQPFEAVGLRVPQVRSL